MNLFTRINHFAGQLLIDGLNRHKTYPQLRASFEQGGQQIAAVLERTPESVAAHNLLRHIVAIERWGQNRLRVALGQHFQLDGSKDHAPAQETSWTELRQSFRDTRAHTLELIGRLEQRNPQEKILHNQWGPISVRGWLGYLNMHANLESKKFKPA